MNEDALRVQLEGVGPTGPLPSLFEDGTLVRVAAFLVKVRSGGFMVALPDLPDVVAFLQDQELELGLEAGAAACVVEVKLENTRGRLLGRASCLLVDLVWELAALFMRASPLRAASLVELRKFVVGEQTGRPRRASVLEAAEGWIHETMDEDTAADYVTVTEAELIPEEPPASMPAIGLQRGGWKMVR